MAITYPATLDTSIGIGTSGVALSTGGSTDGGALQSHKICHDDISAALVAIEAVIGATNSTVSTTHEYRIRRLQWRVYSALDGMPPATNAAVFATVNSTAFLSFATGTGMVFIGVVPNNAILTGGINVRIKWASAAQTSGNCNWGAAYERFGALTTASDHFGPQATQANTPSGTAGQVVETVIPILYTNMSSAVVGDGYRLQIQRVASGDTMTGAAELFTVSIENAT